MSDDTLNDAVVDEPISDGADDLDDSGLDADDTQAAPPPQPTQTQQDAAFWEGLSADQAKQYLSMLHTERMQREQERQSQMKSVPQEDPAAKIQEYKKSVIERAKKAGSVEEAFDILMDANLQVSAQLYGQMQQYQQAQQHERQIVETVQRFRTHPELSDIAEYHEEFGNFLADGYDPQTAVKIIRKFAKRGGSPQPMPTQEKVRDIRGRYSTSPDSMEVPGKMSGRDLDKLAKQLAKKAFLRG